VPIKVVATEWWEKAKPKLPAWEKDKVKFTLMICFGIQAVLLGTPIVVVGVALEAIKRTNELNHDINKQVASFKQQVAKLQARTSLQN